MHACAVKVDVGDLVPGQTYFYSFSAGEAYSPIGRFRVPLREDEAVEQLRYAVFSCSNWGWGFFNAYDAAARYDLDFWLHLGDYIYEYDEEHYPTRDQAVRTGLDPPHELLSLDDYRRRHALYRTDMGLQALSAGAAMIAVWDDHEIANNPWPGGAQNHNEGEGSWAARKAAAVQAYHEWLPTRTRGERIYRAFSFGTLATLSMLENRLVNRTSGEEDPLPADGVDEDGDGDASNDPPSTVARARTQAAIAHTPPQDWDGSDDVAAAMRRLKGSLEAYRSDPAKMVLGPAQMAWLEGVVRGGVARGARWQLLGQQTVVFDTHYDLDLAVSRLRSAPPSPSFPAASGGGGGSGGGGSSSSSSSSGGGGGGGGQGKDIQKEVDMWEEAILNATGWGCGTEFCPGAPRTLRFEDAEAYQKSRFGEAKIPEKCPLRCSCMGR